MPNLILLVQSSDDAAALVPAIAGIKALAPSAIWLIHSPAVLVDLTAANAETDRQIAAVNQQIALCAGREDFEGAKQYKGQRDALTLQKASTATEGYKTMSTEAQEAATKRVFGEFWAAQPAPRMQLSMHPQHHETREWIEMLNSLKGRWPAEMQHGHFVVAWPGEFTTTAQKISKIIGGIDVGVSNPPVVTTSYPPPIAPPEEKRGPGRPPVPYQVHPRYKQLLATGLDELGAIAFSHKLTPSGSARKIANQIAKFEYENGLLK